MGVESPAEEDSSGADMESLHETLGSEAIAFVDTLSTEIEAVITDAGDLQRYDYVIGDVADYGSSSRGHAHFELIHDGTPLHCVLYKFRRSSVSVDIEDGMQLAVSGEVSFYIDNNYCSIIVEDAVAVGTGTYQQTYEENKQLLADDGLLDQATKQPLPEYPQCIGLATSAESDAREDTVTSIHDRHPGVDIVVQDTSVQGEGASQSMIQAIGALDTTPRVDVIVLTRGGGAEKHLRVYNDTALCRVIHKTSTPIVVGVGHEADTTLADEVADQRVMTPTEVGEIVPQQTAIDERLAETGDRLASAYTQTVTTRLSNHERALDSAYEQHVSDELTDLATRLDHAYDSLEQQKRHEQEQAEAARARRRQRIALAALAMLILLLVGYIVLL